MGMLEQCSDSCDHSEIVRCITSGMALGLRSLGHMGGLEITGEILKTLCRSRLMAMAPPFQGDTIAGSSPATYTKLLEL